MTKRGRRVGLAAACWIILSGMAAAQLAEGVAATAHVEDGEGNQAFNRPRLVRELMRRRGGDAAATAQLIQLCRGFDPKMTAACFEELAQAHQAAGNINLAADARALLVQTLPGEPAAREALLWLVRLYASSEVAHMHRPSGALTPEDADRGLATYGYALAGDFAGTTSSAAPPPLVCVRAVAARRAGLTKPAAALLTPLEHLKAGDPWGDCARAEEWLAGSREGPPPKPLARCTPAPARPQLDGVLDEACWQGDAVIEIGPADGAPAYVRLAYDGEYLYLATTCAKLDGVDYARDDALRQHDGDLAERDRVTVVLDADRDYVTGFELTIDSRGWTGDRCWGDAAWNPEWYVASGEGELPSGPAWTAEAAIPWRALAIRAPRTGEAWACSAFREAPGVDVKHWAGGEATTNGPEAFGLLRFE